MDQNLILEIVHLCRRYTTKIYLSDQVDEWNFLVIAKACKSSADNK